MKKLGFFYDQSRCIACKTCQAACKDKNNLPKEEYFRRLAAYPLLFSLSCNHCARPACVKACKTGAMQKNEDGTVSVNAGLCIGCGACVWLCPYGSPKLGALTGKSQKCDACAGPRARGEAPACVAACPAYCLEFGDLQLFEKERGPGFAAVHPLSTDKNATEPSVLIKLRKNRYAEN